MHSKHEVHAPEACDWGEKTFDQQYSETGQYLDTDAIGESPVYIRKGVLRFYVKVDDDRIFSAPSYNDLREAVAEDRKKAAKTSRAKVRYPVILAEHIITPDHRFPIGTVAIVVGFFVS